MLLRMIRRHPVKLLALTAATLIGVACSDNTTTENSKPDQATSNSQTKYDAAWFAATAKPKFTSEGGATPFRTTATIPYWSSSFVDPTNGVTYPYTMVGTSPFNTNSSTTVPTVIIPFRFVFADGTVMDGSDDLSLLQQSPIFQNYTYSLSGNDNTQYGDAIWRAQWNRVDRRDPYHVLLGQPTVLPTLTINVPANQGFVIPAEPDFTFPFPATGLMSYSWFSSQLGNALNT